MGTFIQDIRYSMRMLVKTPGFAAVAVLTLALGIGANIAIFTVVNAVILRPLPFPHADRLVRVMANLNASNVKNVGMSEPELDDLRNNSGLFEQVTAIWPISAALTGGDQPERIEVMATSPEYFELLGAQAKLGRVYGSADGVPGFSDAVVISDSLWRRDFGADPNVLGRKVRMDTDPYTIVGVMAPDFRHPGQTVSSDVDMWAATEFNGPPFTSPPVRNQNFIPGTLGRLRAGITLEQAQSRLDSLASRLRATYPKDYPTQAGWGLSVESAQENLTGNVRPTLSVLLAAVGFVLLIACVNVASLLLARSASRVREMAIRGALGATRGRLMQQLLTESLLLSLAGGVAAVLALGWGKKGLLAMVPADLPRLNEIHFDARVAGFAFLLSLATGIVFGLVPALRVSAVNPNRDLKEGSRSGGASRGQNRFRSALVSTEIALSLVLLIGAGLLVRSFWGMLQVNPGLDPKNVGIAQIWIPVPNNPALNPYAKPGTLGALVAEALRRVSSLPGVEQAAMESGNSLPFLAPLSAFPFVFSDEVTTGGGRPQAEFNSVSPDYFRVLKAPLISGRFLEDGDAAKKESVALVNEMFVRRYSQNREPLGRILLIGRGSAQFRIVGVVGDVHDDGLDAPVAPRIYLSILQRPSNALTIYFRTADAPRGLNESVVRAIHSVDPTLPIFGVRTLEDLMGASEGRRRFVLQLMEIFAAAALLLAALGTYGVMSYAASQRTREIGIRVALGAQREDIVLLALRPGLVLTLIGIAGGLVAALLLTRLMSSLLFAVTATDLTTYAGVSLLLLIVTLAASYIPARRATKVDPIVALRSE
ncbi:MAG TPA: ABC transporter permease [Candidatus Acidoferrales bacterium]|nr:ABC transporter permease [Candidatus Acidoferrales bacterium]